MPDERTQAVPALRLEDVAGAARVSAATVSRALRGDPRISEGTRSRVVQLAAELGYVPDAAARTLATRRSHTFGLLIPDVTDPLHGQVVTGFEQAAGAAGFGVLLAGGMYDVTRERRAAAGFRAHQVDGIAILGGMLGQVDTLAEGGARAPVVLLNGEHPALARTGDLPGGCIRSDDRPGLEALVAHLAGQGHRRIGYLEGPALASNLIRREAVERAANDLGLVAVARLKGSAATPRAVAAAGLDAVICYDDKSALALIDGLRASSLSVPRDLAVAGFDDIPFARIYNPRLTTVAQPAEAVGRQAVAMLLAGLESGERQPSLRLPVRLVVRESSLAR